MTSHELRRIMRSVVLIAVALLLASLAACSTNAPQPTTQHQTYTYNYMSSPSNDHWKPRQQISITWTPQTGPLTADTAPAKVVFTLKLIGPYASVSDLKAASSVTASAAVSAASITTDTWSGKSFAQALDLPRASHPATTISSRR